MDSTVTAIFKEAQIFERRLGPHHFLHQLLREIEGGFVFGGTKHVDILGNQRLIEDPMVDPIDLPGGVFPVTELAS